MRQLTFWRRDSDHIALLGFDAAGNGVESRNRTTSCLRFTDSAVWARSSVGVSIINLASAFSWFVPRLLRGFVLSLDK